MRPHSFRLFALATTAVIAAVAVPVASVAGAALVPATRLVAPAVYTPVGATVLGPIKATQTLNFDVYLTSRSPSGLTAYAQDVTNRHSIEFGHYLARGQFATRFGASPAAVRAMRALLKKSGLRVAGTLVDGLGLRVRGTVREIDRAFSTSLLTYRLANHQLATAAASGLRLPASVAGSVLGVIGLDNLVRPTTTTKRPTASEIRPMSNIRWPQANHPGASFAAHPNNAPGAPAACSTAVSATEQGYGGITDDQVAHAYGVDPLYADGDLGAGQTVAIYELEPFSISDVALFDECYFGTDNTGNISTINVDGGPGQGYGSGESALDIDNVSAIAPDAHIDVYQGSDSEQAATDTYGEIVATDTAQVVTSSWGECESSLVAYSPGTLDVEHLLFEQAAAQGQTVFSSAGDDGADDCAGHAEEPVAPYLSAEDPASQPYVVSVGGTTAVSVTDPPVEQVWNDGAEGGATGGGISAAWAMPSWQTNVASVRALTTSTCGTGSSPCRVTPDVSAFADEYTGITIAYEGGFYTIGGTSSSAPLWAGLLAEVNDSPTCQSSSATANGVGFASPLLYEVGGNPTLAAESYNDITAGNNDIFSINGGAYAATTGYDLASGFGSPDLAGNGGPGLATDLCDAAQESTTSSLTSVSPASGSTAGGTTVTITGHGFETGVTSNVKGVSFGDHPAASFTVNTATQITAVTPPAGIPQILGHTVTAGNEGLVEVTYTSNHVATGPTFSFVHPSGGQLVPLVDQVGPSGGPTSGGNTVDIYGDGFTGATRVTFGGVAAPHFHVLSDSELSAVVPPEGAATCLAVSHTHLSGLCQSSVVVTTPRGASAVVAPLKPLQGYLSYNSFGVPYAAPSCQCEIFDAATEYDFQRAPHLAEIQNLFATHQEPLSNPESGSIYAVLGSGFNWLTLNYMGMGNTALSSNEDIEIGYVSYTTIEFEGIADPDPKTTGNVVPLVANSQGGVSNTKQIPFGGVPKVTGVSQYVLPSSGGVVLNIYGAGLSGGEDVQFFSVFGLPSTIVLANYHVVSSTEIQVLTPSLVPGSYFVSVDGLYGNSSLYTVPLPGQGTAAPFQTLAYTQTNVSVTFPGGAALTHSSGTTCAVAGGCTMTLRGVNLGAEGSVTAYVGDQSAVITSYSTVGNVTTLTLTVPAAFLGEEGNADVFLTTANGQTPKTLDAILTYY